MHQENLAWPLIGSGQKLKFPDGHWNLKTSKPVARGQQYIELYKESTNELILENWGFWFPHNKYKVDELRPQPCGRLRAKTSEHLTEQGTCRVAPGINCSLARLAWEHCRRLWAQ